MGLCDRCGLNKEVYECFTGEGIEMLCEECSLDEEFDAWNDASDYDYPVWDDDFS